jgi:anti-sigma factor RsiW
MFRHVSAGTLAAYVDGELPEGKARMVRDHLASCSSCYRRALKQGQALALLREWAESEAPPTPATRVVLTRLVEDWRRISLVGQGGLFAKRRMHVLVPVVALIFVFFLVYGVQSLVTDFWARGQGADDPRIAAYVEDHVSFETTYRATGISPKGR